MQSCNDSIVKVLPVLKFRIYTVLNLAMYNCTPYRVHVLLVQYEDIGMPTVVRLYFCHNLQALVFLKKIHTCRILPAYGRTRAGTMY
eukprot:SAG31_NODE_344_length_17385_cov_58.217575_4_plen_87_part_00